MDIRDSLFIMRLRSYVEGAKRASQQACDNEQPDKWMLGYSNAMYDVLEYMDTLDGVRAKIDEEMNNMERPRTNDTGRNHHPESDDTA